MPSPGQYALLAGESDATPNLQGGVYAARGFRRRRWAPGPNAKIDWQHPYAHRLQGLWLPQALNGFRSLVNSADQLSSGGSSTITAGVTPWGYGTGETSGSTGARGWVNTSPSLALQPASGVTILWVGSLRSAVAANRRLFGMEANSTNSPPYNAFGIYRASTTTLGYAIDPGGSFTSVASGSIINAVEQFGFAALTYDGATLRGYWQGALVASTSASGSLSYSSPILVCGTNEAVGSSASADALMSMGAIWDRALSSSEIATLYSDPFQMLRTPQRYWVMASTPYRLDATAPSRPKVTRHRERWAPDLTSRINWAHPLAQGLTAFVIPALRFDFATNSAVTPTSGAGGTLTPGVTGMSYAPAAGSGNDILLGNQRNMMTTAATIACQAQSTNNAGDYAFFAGERSNNKALIIQKNNVTSARFALWNADIDFTTDFRLSPVLVGTVVGSSQIAYNNGSQGATGTGSRTVPSTPAYSVAGNTNAPFTGNVMWGALWNRALSASEVAMLSADPFCMFLRGPGYGLVGAAEVNPAAAPTGTAYTSTLTGAVTPVGVITRLVAAIKAGTVTPVGTTQKAAAASKTGTVTPAGALAALRAIVLSLAGTVTPAGTLTKAGSITRSGAVTPVGTTQKTAVIARDGSVTPSGTVAASNVLFLTLAGMVNPSGSIIRAVSARLSGSVTPAGVASKAVAVSAAGTVTPAGAASKLALVTRSGAVTPAGTTSKAAGKGLAGVVTAVGSTVKLVATTVTGTVSPSGAVTVSAITVVINWTSRVRTSLLNRGYRGRVR